MSSNALTDVPWIQVSGQYQVSHATVRDTLLYAHKKGTSLKRDMPGFIYGSQFRFLLGVSAVILRHVDDYRPGDENGAIEKLLEFGIDESAVDKGLKQLSAGADIFSTTFPFLQRPPAEPESTKDSARVLAPGKQPVKKLLPAMPADQGEDFWNLSVEQQDSLDLEDAVQYLAVHHYYSLAGNNSYDGEKCAMGAPGIRFLGKGNTATEVIWEGESLLASLLQSLPKKWVEGEGLPAWCDRQGKTAMLSDGTEHPLWAATWSSNTVACLWEEERRLVGVRTGGIPNDWYLPTMGKEKEDRKRWWDNRNLQDPLYLYIKNSQNELKAQRLDFGRDATDLAVEWAAEDKNRAAREQRDYCVYSPSDDEDLRINFIRHQIEGTASSPSIRASQVYVPDTDRWLSGTDGSVRWQIQEEAKTIRRIHNIVCSPFRRLNENDKKNMEGGYAPVVLDSLEALRDDASANYWRAVTPVYIDFLRYSKEGNGQLPAELPEEVVRAAISAYDATVLPYRNQNIARIEYVRGRLLRSIQKTISIDQDED